MRLENVEFKDVIRDAWTEWDEWEAWVDICVKLKRCRRRLTRWRKKKSGNNQAELKKVKDWLRRIMENKLNMNSETEEATLKERIKEFYHR